MKSSDLPELVAQAFQEAHGNVDQAASSLTALLCTDLKSPHAVHITRLVKEAIEARIGPEQCEGEYSVLDTPGDQSTMAGLLTRRRPVPIPGRCSNAELQAEIDATLDVRMLGGKRLRDFTPEEREAILQKSRTPL